MLLRAKTSQDTDEFPMGPEERTIDNTNKDFDYTNPRSSTLLNVNFSEIIEFLRQIESNRSYIDIL